MLVAAAPRVAAPAHRVDQQALVRLAGHDGRSGVAAGQQAQARIEAQATLLLVGTVAFVARVCQQRPDLFLEEFQIGSGRPSSGRRGVVRFVSRQQRTLSEPDVARQS